MWCDDEAIKPYFIAAGKALKYGNLRRQLSDSLEDRPFPPLPDELQDPKGFVREYTIASSGPYCDCGYKKKYL